MEECAGNARRIRVQEVWEAVQFVRAGSILPLRPRLYLQADRAAPAGSGCLSRAAHETIPRVVDPSRSSAGRSGSQTRCNHNKEIRTESREDGRAGHVRGRNAPLHLHAPDARARARTP